MISTLAFHIFISKSKITKQHHILFSRLFTADCRGERPNVYEKNQYAGNKTEKRMFSGLTFLVLFKNFVCAC